jgi:AbiV family abortive infection protein
MHQGFMMALEQAEHLAQEARVLARKRLFAGALSKAVLGLEEIGKNRLMLYQAATLQIQMGRPAPWKIFWRAYRSHREKLVLAMKWSSITNPDLVSKEALNDHLEFIASEAENLDRHKQESQYVGFDGVGFVTPCDSSLKEEARFLLEVLELLCRRLREQFPVDLPQDEFDARVSEKVRLSKALGLIDASSMESPDDWADAVVEGNSPIFVRDGVLPTVEEFQERVEERYGVVAPRLPVTLSALNSSREFKEFYASIRNDYGYPDWVILCTVFNIALNVRMVSQLKAPPTSDELAVLLDWSEDPDDSPLSIEYFTEKEGFNAALDVWLLAFLTGLGIAIPDVSRENRMKIRRVASRFFSVFEYDVEHWPVFDFEGLEEDAPVETD